MDAIYRAQHVHIFYIISFSFYFTGESLFSSFFPLESSPFFFLLARSWGSRESSGVWGTLIGLRGLMVPGRRGRTIGDGARTGVESLSAVSVVSVGTWGERRWGAVEAWGIVLQKKQDRHRLSVFFIYKKEYVRDFSFFTSLSWKSVSKNSTLNKSHWTEVPLNI